MWCLGYIDYMCQDIIKAKQPDITGLVAHTWQMSCKSLFG